MSELRIHNTLTRKKEIFAPRVAKKVGMYVCGPTVYDLIHVGNARTFTMFDMVSRWLRATGYDVTYVRNITDVDDKIMKRADESGEGVDALTARLIEALHEDLARLGLAAPDREPRATRHIADMLELITLLEKKGLAYRTGDGDMCFSVRSFPGYGKLSHRTPDEMRAGERVAVDSSKRDPLDFVLWKRAKPGEMSWPSPFGEGRPGWHIECSAMSEKELGIPFDIHGGGNDLQFPHHENEIAQSEGALDRPFVAYWMHSAFLNMAHEKMSKSLGNFFTLREVLGELDAVQGGEQLRYFFMRSHYRSEVNYTRETVDDAGQSLRGLYTALREVAPASVTIDWSDPWAARFRDAMNDDFDTPVAFAVLHELRTEVNRTHDARLAGLLKALGGTVGLLQQDPATFLQGAIEVDVQALIDERNAAKKAKNYPRADAIRKELETAGIVLEDKPGGLTEWRKK
ncbi:MAG TPA: cysteine--tRNA ligase [Usitatibacter sp.]|jgi:cysteinyl-tRNA synthetase|nr:cysteine--tRNA ligase [Usitatibacter sp.]